MKRRSVVRGIFAAGLAASGGLAFGEDRQFPNRQVTLVMPIAAGGGGDTVARAIADGLRKQIGFPVIVENKPGGNGVLAAMSVANSPPDAHTVLLGFSGLVQNAALRRDIKDVLPLLKPVGQMVSSGFAFAVSPAMNVQSLDALVKKAKATDTGIDYGSNGIGSIQHLDGQIFGRQAGIRMEHIPYKGGEVESLAAVMSGTIQATFGSPGIFRSFEESGKIKVLAVTGPRRSASLPNVPAFGESGYVDLDMTGWVGAFVAKGTPDADVARLNAALGQALLDAKVRERIAAVGFEVEFSAPEAFARQIDSEIARWKTLGKGVKFD